MHLLAVVDVDSFFVVDCNTQIVAGSLFHVFHIPEKVPHLLNFVFQKCSDCSGDSAALILLHPRSVSPFVFAQPRRLRTGAFSATAKI